MSYGKLNIWIRYLDCNLVKRKYTWLIIKTCGGKFVVDMDPNIVERLKKRYPNFDVTVENVENWTKEPNKGIKITSKTSNVNNIEVDLPPGAYVVWTHTTGCDNEETNKAMVVVNCGEESCVNLILDKVEECGRRIFGPLVARVIERPDINTLDAIDVVGRIAEIPQERIKRIIESRIKYAEELNRLELRKVEAKELTKAEKVTEFIKENINEINLK